MTLGMMLEFLKNEGIGGIRFQLLGLSIYNSTSLVGSLASVAVNLMMVYGACIHVRILKESVFAFLKC